MSFKHNEGKGEIARKEQFLLYPQCFLAVLRPFCNFIKFVIVVCKLFQFGRVLNLSFGKGLLKALNNNYNDNYNIETFTSVLFLVPVSCDRPMKIFSFCDTPMEIQSVICSPNGLTLN